MTDENAIHRAGWSIGVTAFHSAAGGLATAVSGENLIRAEGRTEAAAWWAGLRQASAVGMAPGWRVSVPGVG
jgi:hypothetical protein